MALHAVKKPFLLKLGDTLGIIAPASPFDGDAFDQGITELNTMGFATKLADGIFERQGYLAGSDAQRLAQIHAMLTDKEVHGIICARGGFGSLRILADLDYDLFLKQTKAFIGFSDITALHAVLQEKVGWVSIHGPMVTSLARSDGITRQAFSDLLTGQSPGHLDLTGARCLQGGRAEGILKGGNLSTLCHMVGTPFAGDFKGAILLLEDTGEPLYRIDRMLTQMKLAGAFDGLAGLILGTFDNCGTREQIEALVQAHFVSASIPIVTRAPVGHGERNLPIPLGIGARLDASKVELVYMEKVFAG